MVHKTEKKSKYELFSIKGFREADLDDIENIKESINKSFRSVDHVVGVEDTLVIIGKKK